MTRMTVHSLALTVGLGLLLVAPVLAADPAPAPSTPPASGGSGSSGSDSGGPTAPPEPSPGAPSYLPTGPATIQDPNATQQPDYGRPRLAVIPFVSTYSADGQIIATGAIGDILETELSKCGRFNIVAKKEDLKELINNAQIEQGSGLYDQSTIPALGNYKGADFILMGRVSNAKLNTKGATILGFGDNKETATMQVDFRIVKAETGEVMYSESGIGSNSNSSFALGDYGGTTASGTAAGMFGGAEVNAVKDYVKKLEATDIFPVRALVKGQTSDGKIYIDLGQSTGIYPGLQFNIREVIEDKDVDTGEVLGYRYGDIIGTIVADQVQLDKAICHKTSGEVKRGYVAEVPKEVTLTRPDSGAAGDSQDARQHDNGDNGRNHNSSKR